MSKRFILAQAGILISLMITVPSVCADTADPAVAALKQGQGEKLIPRLNQAVKKQPDSPQLWNNLAVAYIQAGQYEAAARSFDSAATVEPVYKTIYANRQKLLDFMAAQAYQKALGNQDKPKLPSFDVLETSQPVVAPVIPAKPVQQQEQPTASIIRQLITDWSQAWQQGKVDAYLSLYSPGFVAADGTGFEQWKNIRTAKLRFSHVQKLAINDEKLFISTDGKQVVSQFVQTYQAERYQDRVVKQLEWVKQPEGWKIKQEIVLETLK